MSDADRRAAARERQAAPAGLGALQLALKERLEAIGRGFWGLETRSGGTREPVTYHFTLPPKTPGGDDVFPFFALRPRTGRDSEESAEQDSRATIDIEVGTFSDTDDGSLDLLNIIQAIRDSIISTPTLEGTAFVHFGPLTWEIPFPQPRPQWLGFVTTVWQIPRPHREA